MGSPYFLDNGRESPSNKDGERRRNPVRAVRSTKTTPDTSNITESCGFGQYPSNEAPWDEQGTTILKTWIQEAKKESVLHRNRGFYLKKSYRFLGISSIVVAALVFLTDQIQFSDDQLADKAYHSIFAFINLVFVNISSFLNLGPKYQEHFEFEGRYIKVGIEMEEILATDIQFRAPKDRTLAEYKEIVGNLFTSAPEV